MGRLFPRVGTGLAGVPGRLRFSTLPIQAGLVTRTRVAREKRVVQMTSVGLEQLKCTNALEVLTVTRY